MRPYVSSGLPYSSSPLHSVGKRKLVCKKKKSSVDAAPVDGSRRRSIVLTDTRTQEEKEREDAMRYRAPAVEWLTNSKLAVGVHAETDADPELLAAVARKLEFALQQMPDKTMRSWGKMFFKYDQDGSGRMEYGEVGR